MIPYVPSPSGGYTMTAYKGTARICAGFSNRASWRVWVTNRTGSGWLRQGFGWRTLNGAINAAKAAGYEVL